MESDNLGNGNRRTSDAFCRNVRDCHHTSIPTQRTIASNNESLEIDDEIASRGSSVSTNFIDEYNQLMQYAVVLPSLNFNAQQSKIENMQLQHTTSTLTQPNDATAAPPIQATPNIYAISQKTQPPGLAATQDTSQLTEPNALNYASLCHSNQHNHQSQQTTHTPYSNTMINKLNAANAASKTKTTDYSPMFQAMKSPSNCVPNSVNSYNFPATTTSSSGVHSEHHYPSDSNESSNNDKSCVGSNNNLPKQPAPQNNHTTGSANQPSCSNTQSSTNTLKVFDTLATQMKLALNDEISQQIQQEKNKFQQHFIQQQQQFTGEMKSMLTALKDAQTEIERLGSELEHKDEIIQRLLTQMDRQRSEMRTRQALMKWKDVLRQRKSERLASHFAERYYQQGVLKKSIHAWRDGIESQWKERVQVNCQEKAESVCQLLATKYEAQIFQLQSTIQDLKNENTNLRTSREHFQTDMRDAFMRGVCALNIEAMKVLSPSNSKVTTDNSSLSTDVSLMNITPAHNSKKTSPKKSSPTKTSSKRDKMIYPSGFSPSHTQVLSSSLGLRNDDQLQNNRYGLSSQNQNTIVIPSTTPESSTPSTAPSFDIRRSDATAKVSASSKPSTSRITANLNTFKNSKKMQHNNKYGNTSIPSKSLRQIPPSNKPHLFHVEHHRISSESSTSNIRLGHSSNTPSQNLTSSTASNSARMSAANAMLMSTDGSKKVRKSRM